MVTFYEIRNTTFVVFSIPDDSFRLEGEAVTYHHDLTITKDIEFKKILKLAKQYKSRFYDKLLFLNKIFKNLNIKNFKIKREKEIITEIIKLIESKYLTNGINYIPPNSDYIIYFLLLKEYEIQHH